MWIAIRDVKDNKVRGIDFSKIRRLPRKGEVFITKEGKERTVLGVVTSEKPLNVRSDNDDEVYIMLVVGK